MSGGRPPGRPLRRPNPFADLFAPGPPPTERQRAQARRALARLARVEASLEAARAGIERWLAAIDTARRGLEPAAGGDRRAAVVELTRAAVTVARNAEAADRALREFRRGFGPKRRRR